MHPFKTVDLTFLALNEKKTSLYARLCGTLKIIGQNVRGYYMSIETSLTYQKKFFSDFTDAWHKKSRYRLYQGIDATAENLRLDIEEAPGYILA